MYVCTYVCVRERERSCKFVRSYLLLVKLAWSLYLCFWSSFEHATFKQFLYEKFGQTIEHEDDERTWGVVTTTT